MNLTVLSDYIQKNQIKPYIIGFHLVPFLKICEFLPLDPPLDPPFAEFFYYGKLA